VFYSVKLGNKYSDNIYIFKIQVSFTLKRQTGSTTETTTIFYQAIRYFKSQHQKQNISFCCKAMPNSQLVPTWQGPRSRNKCQWKYRVCLQIRANELCARNQHRVRNTTNCVPLRRSHSNRREVTAPAHCPALITPHKLHTNLATLHLPVDR